MIPIIGIVVCLHIFTRSLHLASDPSAHPAPRISAGAAALAAMIATGLLVRAARDASAALDMFMGL